MFWLRNKKIIFSVTQQSSDSVHVYLTNAMTMHKNIVPLTKRYAINPGTKLGGEYGEIVALGAEISP